MSKLDDFLDHEQHWHRAENREMRQERKILQRTDRSKYRKSDQDAEKKRQELGPSINPSLHRGRVVEICAGDIFVQGDASNQPRLCHIKGSFKSERSRTKNLVAVGDYVLYSLINDNESGQIHQVEPRRTVLSRADNLNHTKQQILATNVDWLVIVFSFCEPILSLNLIDRYLIAAAQGGLRPLLLLSKLDLLEADHVPEVVKKSEKSKLDQILTTYSLLDIPIICYRQDNPTTLRSLEELLKDHTCVVSGPSGVGKSTLLSIMTGRDLRVQPVCIRTRRGSHTTSHAQFIALRLGGWCVDTPGIRSFGLWKLDRSSVDNYFSEISSLASTCQFRDCHHLQEPGCSVRSAVDAGKISVLRYESYLNLMQELEDKHLRR